MVSDSRNITTSFGLQDISILPLVHVISCIGMELRGLTKITEILNGISFSIQASFCMEPEATTITMDTTTSASGVTTVRAGLFQEMFTLMITSIVVTTMLNQ